MGMTNTISNSDKIIDPIGHAVRDYLDNMVAEDIIVESDICEPDIIPVSYLFRTFEEMPVMEQEALKRCSGKILDVGCGAGAHLKWLKKHHHDVIGVDISSGCIQHLRDSGFNAVECDFRTLNQERYDTILLMMNGIGLAGNLKNLQYTLSILKDLLRPNGKILLDSTDIKYLYTEDDGTVWADLNSDYYGNFMFRMSYKEQRGEWFEWLYVDFENLNDAANVVGLTCELIIEEDDQYLAELTLNK